MLAFFPIIIVRRAAAMHSVGYSRITIRQDSFKLFGQNIPAFRFWGSIDRTMPMHRVGSAMPANGMDFVPVD